MTLLTPSTAVRRHRVIALLLGFALGAGIITSAAADDTEIFAGDTNLASGVSPNVLLIIDTSGSMRSEVRTQVPYDPAETYAGACDPNRIYWAREGNDRPDCGADQWFSQPALRCLAARGQLDHDGISVLDFMARWNAGEEAGEWRRLNRNDKTSLVECRADSGVHGNNEGDAEVYAADNENGPWSSDRSDEVEWGDGNTDSRYTLFTGNYINWTQTALNVTSTRIEIVQRVTNSLLENLSGVNIGIMRFSNNRGSGDAAAEGGMVVHAVEPVELGRTAMQAEVNRMRASGWTPLSETMYEAALYYRGKPVDYGLNSRGNSGELLPSVPESRTGPGDDGGDLYLSPVSSGALSCQKNFIVLLTDGLPTRDNSADGKIAALTNPDFAATTGRASCDGSGAGRCLDDVAEYLFKGDLNDDDSDGKQNVITYTIGFLVDLGILDQTATRGGGKYYTANDAQSLEAALTSIVTDIVEDNTSFVAPAVSVNAFNRTESLDELFMAVFQASNRPLWNGNLKKYRLKGDIIVGADGTTPVVDPNTGYFSDSATSIWSSTVDGADVTLGGAANLLPDPDTRRVYSNLSGDANVPLTAPGNHVVDSNAAIDETVFGIGAGGDPSVSELIAFARGQDVNDEDGDGITAEARRFMGDPLHARPATVVYGGSGATPDPLDAVVYLTTNEGFLHAIDARTGSELFAFIPSSLLPRMADWYDNDPSPFKGYGLDGSIRARLVDRNSNGIIEPSAGDRVILYFGMRRGGDSYFAVEVTNRNAPELLWQIDDSDLPGLGQTWSTPVVTRVAVQGASQNSEKAVLIFGGGYDVTQDNPGYSTDASGNGIYMVDAESGLLLWHAGPDATADLQNANMTHSIPAGVSVLDLNSDDVADRMYVGDMGGRLWRFDIFSGRQPRQLVTGGVIASLGAAGMSKPDSASNRRFFNTPDVSLMRRESASYLNIAIGSGYRAHPLDTRIKDSFYAIRDYNPFRQLSAAEYALLEEDKLTHKDARLADITGKVGKAVPTVPAGAMGWRMDMAPGEKVLSRSRTFQEKIFFTSYSPSSESTAHACAPQRGSNKLYVVSVADGRPPYNLDGIGSADELTLEDRAQSLKQTGIAPDVTFMFQYLPDDANGDGDGDEGPTDCAGATVRPRCLVGLESCAADFCNAPVKTFWTQDAATEMR